MSPEKWLFLLLGNLFEKKNKVFFFVMDESQKYIQRNIGITWQYFFETLNRLQHMSVERIYQ